jgi:hypothetical protein
MIITKKAIRRRTVLRGIGAAFALPLLDAMAPALRAFDKTEAKPAARFGAVYVPNGIMMENWTPPIDGAAFEFTPILKPLEPFRQQMLVLSGLNSTPPPGNSGPLHSRASTRFLTDMPPKATLGADLHAGISTDQILAKEFGQHTQLASLELALDSPDSVGPAEGGYSSVYISTISWRTATTPLPMEHNPRAVFERLFGDTGNTDPAARLARMQEDRSILDSVIQKVGRLQRELGPQDRLKVTEYFDAIRDAERRIQKAEEQNDRSVPLVDHPAGVPATFEEHAKLMYDLYLLAYQCDLTRVVTFMIGKEFCGRTYPELGVHDSHHATSHHQNDPEKLARLVKINTYHTTLFANFLEKLRSTPDGDGSLLDHTTMVYGGGMSDGNTHDPKNLPILLLGGGCGQIKGGRHLRFSQGTPLANLHLTLLEKMGIPMNKIGDSTGEFEQLSV